MRSKALTLFLALLAIPLLCALSLADPTPGGGTAISIPAVAPSPSPPVTAPDVIPPPSPSPAPPPPVVATPPIPSTEPGVGELLTGAGDMIHAYRTGGWLAALAAAVALLTSLLRTALMGKLLDKIPKRLRILVPLLLGCLGALLVALSGGVQLREAVVLALLTGPSAVALHQGVSRSLLGVDSPDTAAMKARAGG